MEKTCISQHTGGTAGAIFNVLDCESRDPVLVEIRSKIVFPSAVPIRAAISFLRKSGHSILTNYLSGYLEQCRSVNPFIRTGVFNPSKLTDWSVIIGSLVLLHVTAGIFILFQKLLYHLSKQCRPLSDISFIHHLPCAYVGSALFVKFLYMGARHYWASWLCSNNVEMYCLSALMVSTLVNNLSVISGRFMNFWVEPVLSRTYKVYS